MSKEYHVSAHVGYHVEADSEEEAEEKARKEFLADGCWSKGYLDWHTEEMDF